MAEDTSCERAEERHRATTLGSHSRRHTHTQTSSAKFHIWKIRIQNKCVSTITVKCGNFRQSGAQSKFSLHQSNLCWKTVQIFTYEMCSNAFHQSCLTNKMLKKTAGTERRNAQTLFGLETHTAAPFVDNGIQGWLYETKLLKHEYAVIGAGTSKTWKH